MTNFKQQMISLFGIFVLMFSNFNLGLSQTKSPTSKDQPQPKFALLIGLTKFKNQIISQIDGCQNNVPALAETLIKDYGFAENNVLSLVNEQATKNEIINKFRKHLIENAKKSKEQGKEAVIVYYFCGHGSQFPDQDGDENDGKDETFVAYDSRTDGVFDILDDEMDDLKSELRPFTSNTTLILESCHSGTGSRGDFNDQQFISQEADDDQRERTPYKRKFPPSTDADSLTYTEIAASLNFKTAKSESAKYCNCEKPMSLMTKALVQGLKRATHTTTYRGLMSEVSSEVGTQSQQDPQVEGNRDAILFGGVAKRANPYIEIDRIMPNNEVLIKAGTIHGLKVGSQVSIYSSESLTNTGKEHWLTNGTVSRVGNANSIVKIPTLQENPKVKDIKVSSHVVLASPVFGGGSVLLALNTETTRTLNEQDSMLYKNIEERLNLEKLVENQIIKIIPTDKITPAERKEAKGIIRLKKGKVKDVFVQAGTNKYFPMNPLMAETACDGENLITNSREKRFPDAEKEVYYLDDGESGGAPLFGRAFDPKDENLAEDIANTIRNYAYQNNLRSLDNSASDITSQIKITLQTIPDDAIIEKCQDGQKRSLRNGEKFTGFQDLKGAKLSVGSYFQIKIKNISGEIRKKKDEFAAGEPFYIAVIGLTTAGEIDNIYASKGDKDPLMDDGEIIRTLKLTEPVGVERFIVIVSKDYVDFSFYESRGTSRNAKSILEQVLKQSGTRTRDVGTVVTDEPDRWDVIHIEMNVVEK